MSFKKHTAQTLFSNILVVGLSVANSVLLARLLGPEGRGHFAIYQASVNLLTIWLSFGLQSSLVYFLSKDERILKPSFNFLAVFFLVIDILFFTIYFFFQDRLPVGLLPKTKDDLEGIVLLCISIYAFQMFSVLISIYTSFFQFNKANITRILLPALMFSAFILFYLPIFKPYLSVENFMRLNTLAYVLNFVAMWIPIRSKMQLSPGFAELRNKPGILTADFKGLKTFFAWGLLAYLANAAQFLNYRLDYWLVEYFKGPKDLGYYSIASGLAQMIWIIPGSVSGVLFPYIAKNSGDNQAIKSVNIARIIFYICLLLGGSGFIISDFVIPLIYGKEFIPSALAFKIILVGAIPFTITNILAGHLAGVNLVKINLMGSVIGLVVTILLDLLLIPDFGITGAAAASAASYFITTLVVIFYFANKYNIPLRNFVLLNKNDLNILHSIIKKYRAS
ncbi:MAG: polysaccharide biosynthesis protein [Vicingaceae bacterium]|nr:MAG: polysaccharide biosynthesis protein [Vicingaceae bacterium]